MPIQTHESIVTADGINRFRSHHRPARVSLFELDLPQLHTISYNPKETFLRFDYLPTHAHSNELNEEKICLNIRQSADGKIYRSANSCLSIVHRRAQWVIDEQNPYLRLSVCSRKRRHICGPEIEMKEGKLEKVLRTKAFSSSFLRLEFKNLSLTPMIVAIAVFLGFISLIMTITFVLMCNRSRQIRLKNHRRRSESSGSRLK